MRVSIETLGAKNNGQLNNASIIQIAIDTVHKAGGGQVVIPSGGIYLSGSIELKENVELHLEGGATLRASSDYSEYTNNHNIKNLTDGSVDEFVLPNAPLLSPIELATPELPGMEQLMVMPMALLHNEVNTFTRCVDL